MRQFAIARIAFATNLFAETLRPVRENCVLSRTALCRDAQHREPSQWRIKQIRVSDRSHSARDNNLRGDFAEMEDGLMRGAFLLSTISNMNGPRSRVNWENF